MEGPAVPFQNTFEHAGGGVGFYAPAGGLFAQQDGGIGGFLRQLLPKNVNTEDLLIILLLLLMSGDCAEDQNTALLTLAIYLFL